MTAQETLQTITFWPLIVLALAVVVAIVYRKKFSALIRKPEEIKPPREVEENDLREQQRSKEQDGREIPEPGQGITMVNHVFICYAREDEAFVLQLCKNLKEWNVPVWVDQWDIRPGADWDRSIDKAINDCAEFIIILSPQAVESPEVRGELRIALDKHKPVIPVIHLACQIPRQLLLIQHVDFTSRRPDDEATLRQLIHTLTTRQGTPPEYRGIAQSEDQSPSAALVFDPSSTKHVQRGNVVRRVVGGDQECDEYKYAIGVVNLSSRPISCQLVLDHSDPHNTSVQRLEVPLRVRGQTPESDGKFILAPGNKQPTGYVEVLQELVPKSNPMNEHAVIRLIYANSADGMANWFQDHRDQILTFRLQGDMPGPVTIKISVCSENRRYVVRHLA